MLRSALVKIIAAASSHRQAWCYPTLPAETRVLFTKSGRKASLSCCAQQYVMPRNMSETALRAELLITGYHASTQAAIGGGANTKELRRLFSKQCPTIALPLGYTLCLACYLAVAQGVELSLCKLLQLVKFAARPQHFAAVAVESSPAR